MHGSPLDFALAAIGPIPHVFRFAIDVAYWRWRHLVANQEGFAEASVRTQRSLVHDNVWSMSRHLLAGLDDYEFIIEEQAEVLVIKNRYKLQVHKVDALNRIALNGTKRPREILGQSYLWGIGEMPRSGFKWLTIGHVPNTITMSADSVVIGLALEDGMADFSRIEPDADRVAAISKHAADEVRRQRDIGAA